jgi:RHS repeat-associated protein
VSYEEYFPYGSTSFIAGPNQVDVSLKTYRYSGKECDNSTGLYYYGRRYYVSWLGRWLNPDPAGTVDGLNLFAFVGGNPVTNKDENGLSKRPAKVRRTGPKPADGFDSDDDNTRATFGETPGIWSRGTKKRTIGPDEHFLLGEQSYGEGKAQGGNGPIFLYRVGDKNDIPSKKGQVYTTPGPPWTPQRSVAWVKGGIQSGATFILTTDPTNEESFTQSRGTHSDQLAIYAREVSELLANNYIPVMEQRSKTLKRGRVQDSNDYLIALVPGRTDQQASKKEWPTISGEDIPSFNGDAFSSTGATVTAEDLAETFQQYTDLFAEDDRFKLYGTQYGPPASSSKGKGKK